MIQELTDLSFKLNTNPSPHKPSPVYPPAINTSVSLNGATSGHFRGVIKASFIISQLVVKSFEKNLSSFSISILFKKPRVPTPPKTQRVLPVTQLLCSYLGVLSEGACDHVPVIIEYISTETYLSLKLSRLQPAMTKIYSSA